MDEFSYKQTQIQKLLDKHNLSGLLLEKVTSFAWATCGADTAVNTASTNGVASLLITRDKRYLITNNIEAPRLDQEDKLISQGWEFVVNRWYEEGQDLAELVGDGKIGTDGCYPGSLDLSAEISHCRSRLTAEEQHRFKALGKLCAEAMARTIDQIEPGMSEHQIAAHLAAETESRGVRPIANMVATDERIFMFRHPLPSGKELDRYAMVVLCGRKNGLVCSLTRLVHFGTIPDGVQNKMQAVAEIDAAFIMNTRPGKTIGEVFSIAKKAYAGVGYPEEWQNHHQGGPAGYEPREAVAVPGSLQQIYSGQFYAWNPSIAGAKSEDTIFVGEDHNEIITEITGWPTIQVIENGNKINRPSILQK